MPTQSHIHSLATQHSARKGFFRHLAIACDVWRQRRALAQLDAAALKDIGVTQGEAVQESLKPVWNAPQHWTR